MVEIVMVGGFAYILADVILAFTINRCVLPGLRCSACRAVGRHTWRLP